MPHEVSQHYSGETGGPVKPFGLDPGPFGMLLAVCDVSGIQQGQSFGVIYFYERSSSGGRDDGPDFIRRAS